MNPKLQVNYCNKPGAEALAKSIKIFWSKRGHDVDVQLEPYRKMVPPKTRAVDQEEFETFWCVRSNLVNGLPQ